MNQDSNSVSLDDESLKRAAARAWGNGAASPELRQRVQMAMTRAVLEEPSLADSTRLRRFWDAWPKPARFAAAVAALLLVATGMSWGIMRWQDSTPYTHALQPNYLSPVAEPTLYAILVTRHDDFAAGEDAPPAEVLDSQHLQALCGTLAQNLQHAVWIPDLMKLGWKLDGLRVYPINGVSALAAHFSRGSDSITAFSLPVAVSDSCAGGVPDADEIIDKRSFSSFSSGNDLFALIGSRGDAPFPQADLRSLVTQFRADPICRSACP